MLTDKLRRHLQYMETGDGERLRLERAVLVNRRFVEACLANARFSDCVFRKSCFLLCDAERAYFSGCSFDRADLTSSCFAHVRFAHCSFDQTNMQMLNAQGSTFVNCTLRRCDMKDAFFASATFVNCDLSKTSFYGADLTQVYFSNCKMPDYQLCPKEGEFYGWRKLRCGTICRLRIPAGARRTSTLVSNRCRADVVHVVEGQGCSRYDNDTSFFPGSVVRVPYDPDPTRDDGRLGVTFYRTFEEALAS